MEAGPIDLQTLINAPKQYVIPVFQRYYSWKEKNWKTLWEDIEELSDPEIGGSTHFMGPLVFFALPQKFTGINHFQVIDGQQRLMTFALLFCAVRYMAHELEMTRLAEEIHNNFLIHEYAEKSDRFRIFPRQRDRDEFIRAVLNPTLDIDGQIGAALRYFVDRVRGFIAPDPKPRLQALVNLLKTRLEFVYIQLGNENPYEIFKSLNSTGIPLAQADLIRNFVFMHVDVDEQDRFDDDLWKPLEAHFEYKDGEKAGQLSATALTAFFRDYLMLYGRYIAQNAIFSNFEARYEADGSDPYELAKKLKYNAELYDIIRGRASHTSSRVTRSLQKLRALDSSTTYPVLLKLLHFNKEGSLSDDELSYAIDMLTGFILRRFVLGWSSRGYGPSFASSSRSLSKDPVANLRAFLTEKGYPTDDQFRKAFVNFRLYTSRYARSILEALERAIPNKERPDLSQTSIEHVMPRALSSEWRDYLGEDAQQVHNEWLHSPGNLTLSAYHGGYGNGLFERKRPMYKDSNIRLTKELAEYEHWGAEQIQARGQKLAELAAKIWIGPDGSAS